MKQLKLDFEKHKIINYKSPYNYIRNKNEKEIFAFYNSINNDTEHMKSRDDISTPMECVKIMIDYIPKELWQRKNIRILDPCAGNGNFGAYCMKKTDEKNIWFNEISDERYINCKTILNPTNIGNYNFFDMKGDFLGQWDLIMANPPYAGNGNKNRGLSNLFIEKSIDLLKDNGYLCYVTPNNWMTYNNNNITLKKLLNEGSFVVIDNDVKKYFPGIGSSFTIMIWQKGVFDNKTYVVNNFLVKDIQENMIIPRNIPFIPLYLSNEIISITMKLISSKRNLFDYRCDLHNYTQKKYLSDYQDDVYKYETIHTLRKTRYASKKQDIYNNWIIIIPLSTYYIPVIKKNVNVTQSVGYIPFKYKKDAQQYLNIITQPYFKLIIHLTRYGNFNNIMVLKHLNFDKKHNFTKKENDTIKKLTSLIKY